LIWRELPPTAGLPLQWSDFTQPAGESLENLLAKFLGVSQVWITSSGTAALVLAFECLKRLFDSQLEKASSELTDERADEHRSKRAGQRTEVIIPGYSCPLVVHAAQRAGLSVVLCDTQPGSFDFDYDQLRLLCTEQTLCVVPTHLGGIAADSARCKEIAKASGAFVVEDAAQALGTKIRGQYAGTIGDIGMFSLTVGKGLSIYEGGFIVCEEPSLAATMAQTIAERVHPDTIGERQKLIELVGLWALYNPVGLHWVYGRDLRHWLKSNDPQRAVGDVFEDEIELHQVSETRKRVGASAFTRLPEFLSANASRGKDRAARLSALKKIIVLGLSGQESDLNTFPFLFVLTESQETTKTIMDKLWTKGLGVTKLFYRCLCDDPHLRGLVSGAATPNARDFASRAFTITNSPLLSDADFDKVYSTISSVVSQT
jgi:dTDP-4-amino-4,6-dideoxygalactose transaminase